MPQRKNKEEMEAARLSLKKIKKSQIHTHLEVKTWIWEKEASHRLFNFSEGYVELPERKKMVGSCKYLSLVNSYHR